MPLPFRALIIDMDGVLWHGDRPQPGLTEFFAFLRAAAIRFVLATNNASATVAQYQSKLAAFGVTVTPDEVLTSAQGTALYLAARIPGGRVYPIGETGVPDAMLAHGFVLVDESASEADAVVVGWDRTVTWPQLRQACLLIRRGAQFIGTNPDRTYPTPEGLVPGNGAILAALQAATDVIPVIVGKPEPLLYQQAQQRLGTPSEVTAGLGDRLDTDILGAQRAGLRSILVLSGVTGPRELAASPIRPDEVYPDIAAITEAWRALR